MIYTYVDICILLLVTFGHNKSFDSFARSLALRQRTATREFVRQIRRLGQSQIVSLSRIRSPDSGLRRLQFRVPSLMNPWWTRIVMLFCLDSCPALGKL